MFAERGFAAARMDEVARRAGISKGTLYLYFPDKEALFKALVREAIVSTLGEAETLVEHYQGPSADLLRELVERFRALMHRPNVAALPKLIIAEAGNFPDLARFYLTEVISRGLGLIGRAVQRGVERGEFRREPLEFTAPQEASVVAVAKRAEPDMPKRTSLPSKLVKCVEKSVMRHTVSLSPSRSVASSYQNRFSAVLLSSRHSACNGMHSAYPARISPQIRPKPL